MIILCFNFSSSSFCNFSYILFWFWKNFWKFLVTFANSIFILLTYSMVVRFWSSVTFSKDFFELFFKIYDDIEQSSDLSFSVTSFKKANFETFWFYSIFIYLLFYSSISCFCLNVKLSKFYSGYFFSHPSLLSIIPLFGKSN